MRHILPGLSAEGKTKAIHCIATLGGRIMKNRNSVIGHILCMLLTAVLLAGLCAAASGDVPAGYPEVRTDIDFGGMDVYFYDWFSADYWDSYNTNPHTEAQEAQHAYRLWLQDTYNVQIHTVSRADWGSIADDMIDFVSRGGEAGKLALYTQRNDEVLRIISAGAAAPITYNMTSGKWNRADISAATVRGKTYGTHKGMSEPRQCLFFNKRLLEEAGINWNSLYDAQDEGTWTWAMFTNVLSQIKTSGVSAPITGSRDELLKIAVYTGGGAFISKDSHGDIVPSVDSNETRAALAWAIGLWDSYSMQEPEDAAWDWFDQAWVSGQSAFYIDNSYKGFNSGFSGMTDAWGCLAFPKKEATGNYINLSSDNIIMIPSCYDSATVDKLMFIYDMWTLDTPGYPEDESWSDRFQGLTDDRAIETYGMLSDPDNQAEFIILEDISNSFGMDLLWLINIDNIDEVTSECARKWQKQCEEYNPGDIGGYIEIFPQKSFRVGAGIDYNFDAFDQETDQYVHLLLEDGEDLIPVAIVKAWDASLHEKVSAIPAGKTTVAGHYYLTLGPEMEYGGINSRYVASTDLMICADSLAIPEFRDVVTGGAPGRDVSGTILLPEGTVSYYIEMVPSFYWEELTPSASSGQSFRIPGLYMPEAGTYQIQVTALSRYLSDEPNPGTADSETAVYDLTLEGEDVPDCPYIQIDNTELDYPDKEITYTISGAEEVAYQFQMYEMYDDEFECGSGISTPVEGSTGTINLSEGPGRYEFVFWAKINGIWSKESNPVKITLNPLGSMEIPDVYLDGNPVSEGVTVRRTDDLSFTVSCEHASWFSCEIWEQLKNGEFSYYDDADVENLDGNYTFSLEEGNLPDGLYQIRITPYGTGYSRTGSKEFLLAFADDGVDTLSWSLENGVLTISGNGYMVNYDWGGAPWDSESSSITDIVIESGVRSIGSYAFPGFNSLESVTIPDTVTNIGRQSFAYCRSLTNITVPAGVTSIESLAFGGCESLGAINVDSGNAVYASENGVLFNKGKTELITYPGGKNGAYTIPGTVTRIAAEAFSECSGLTGVSIPDSVAQIGSVAFSRTGLVNVAIPASVTQIDYDAFAGCGNLISINVDSANPSFASEDGVLFNKNMTTLDTYPAGKTGDYTIPDGVTFISDYAFAECGGLTGVTIPESVTFIDYCAFADCDNLTNVWYYGDRSQWSAITIIEGNSCLTNALLKLILHGECGDNLSWILDLNGVLTISGTGPMDDYPKGAGQPPWRWNSSDITSIVIGDGVTHIGERAFWYATSLPEIVIPAGVTSIGDEAFEGCSRLNNIIVDSGNTAFSSADGVLFNYGKTTLIACPGGKKGEYTIPDGVTTIRDYAFAVCMEITDLTIPDSVTTIGQSAFFGCSKLAAFNAGSNNAHYSSGDGVLFNKDKTVLIAYPNGKIREGECTIPGGITSIGARAFESCYNLTDIIIPVSVTSIGDYAFSSCNNLSSVSYGGDEDQWDTISIGEGNQCLTGADFLFNAITEPGDISWNLENGVLTISGTGRMANYEYEDPAPWYDKRDLIQSVVIEDGVTGIGNLAFREYETLSTVTMADSVKIIGNGAFQRCTSLTGIRLSDQLTDIGSWAFQECSGLASITLPGSLRRIGMGAFASCNISSIAVSDGGTATWDFFYPLSDTNGYHDYLYHIKLPAGIREVEEGAFCENPLPHDRPDFILPSGLKTIESGAFSGVDARFVWIPEEVETIGSGAFAGCSGLEYVYIPYNCESIGENAIPSGAKILVFGGYGAPPCPAEIYANTNGNDIVEYENPYGGNG